MRVTPVGSPTWRARYLAVADPVDPVGAADLDALLARRSFRDDEMPGPGARRGRRSAEQDDGPDRSDTIDVREGRVLPEMTAEQFEAFRRSDHGTARPDAGRGHAYGSRLVIDLTDTASTIDLRA